MLLTARLHRARVSLLRGRPAEAIGPLERVAREAATSGLKYVELEAKVRLAAALLATGDASGAGRRLRGALTELERSSLRPLLAECHRLLALVDAESGDQHRSQARRLLDEIREEAGEEDPFRRRDLSSIDEQVGDTLG
jgi:hypothetical protein